VNLRKLQTSNLVNGESAKPQTSNIKHREW
jgi:hypothetical protein